MPDYWFASRSRYFVKNHGIAYARCADMAFLIGLSFCRIRNFFSRRADAHRPRMLRDFLRSSILFRSASFIGKRVGGLHNE